MVIKDPQERLECLSNISEIDDPPCPRCYGPRNDDFDLEGMAMQPRTFVALGHIRQSMGCLNLKALVNVHRPASNALPSILSRLAPPTARVYDQGEEATDVVGRTIGICADPKSRSTTERYADAWLF